MRARFTGSNDAKTRNPGSHYPLPADQIRLARAMAGVLLDAAQRTGAPFQQGDLVIKRYVSSSRKNDLLCLLGNADALTEIIDFARSLGADDTEWTEGESEQARS